MKTKAEIIAQNNLNPHMIEGFQAHNDKPLLTIIFKPKDKNSQNFRLHFNMMTGKELTDLEVRFDTWSGDDVGPVCGGARQEGKTEKMNQKKKLREKPKRIERKGKKSK